MSHDKLLLCLVCIFQIVKEQWFSSFVNKHSVYLQITTHSDICNGGATRDRTADLLNANQALSQLSYSPIIGFYFWLPLSPKTLTRRIFSQIAFLWRQSWLTPVSRLKNSRWGKMVGLGGFEPPTSPLSGVRSNQLSYRPRYLSSNIKQCVWILTKT